MTGDDVSTMANDARVYLYSGVPSAILINVVVLIAIALVAVVMKVCSRRRKVRVPEFLSSGENQTNHEEPVYDEIIIVQTETEQNIKLDPNDAYFTTSLSDCNREKC